MKIKGYTVTLLFTCFSVYLVHNLLPHHHHLEVALTHSAGECPMDHQDLPDGNQDESHIPGSHPAHCHAFNDVVFDTHSVKQILPDSRYLASGDLPPIMPEAVPPEDAAFSRYHFRTIPYRTEEGLAEHALRGPPSRA